MDLNDIQAEEEIKKYKDPRGARAVWDECKPDVTRLGCYPIAYTILTNTRDVDSLDLKLSRLITNRERTKGR